jgi:hypothetical protein
MRNFALFLLVALVLRAPWLGDPLFHADEQFYLLMGDRLWHGVIPMSTCGTASRWVCS